jgi:hypothetical protein
VTGDNAVLRIDVHAGSIEQAVRRVEAMYGGGRVRVIFPLNPETFFVTESVLGEGLAGDRDGRARRKDP